MLQNSFPSRGTGKSFAFTAGSNSSKSYEKYKQHELIVTMFTHCIGIFQTLIQLRVRKNGVAFADSPQHSFKCFNLCYVN